MKTFRATIEIDDDLYKSIKIQARVLREPVKDVLLRMAQATFELHVTDDLCDEIWTRETADEGDKWR